MAEKIEVASLVAPITIKVPKQAIEAFKQDLKDIQKMLRGIVKDFREIEKSLLNIFTRRRSKLNIKVDHTERKSKIKEASPEEKEQEGRAKRVSKIYGEWADKLSQVRVLFGLLKFYVESIAKTILIPSGMLAGLIFLAQKINSVTTEMNMMAKVTGVSLDTLRSLDLEAKNVGMSFNNVKDVLEELNEKMGAEANSIIDPKFRQGLYLLGLDIDKLVKLKPDKQLDLIMNASKRLADKGKMQEVSTAFKSLFGGQSQMLLGSFVESMKEADLSFQQLIERNLKANSLSKESVDGARAWVRALNYVISAVKTLSEEFFGLVGNALKPFTETFMATFDNLKESMNGLFDFLVDTVVNVLIDSFVLLVKLFDYIRSNPESVKKVISTFVTTLKNLFNVGVSLTKILVAMSPVLILLFNSVLKVVEALTSWINTDIGSAIFSWLATIGILTYSVYKLFGALEFLVYKMFPLFLSFIGTTLPKAMLALKVSVANLGTMFLWMGRGILTASGAMMTFGRTALIAMSPLLLVVGKFLLIIGAIATVAYTMYVLFKKIFELTGITNFTADLMESWFFDKGNKEKFGASLEQQSKAHIERFKSNQARLQAVNNTNSTTNSNTSVTTYNTTNHVVVNDVTTGRTITKQILPARPD